MSKKKHVTLKVNGKTEEFLAEPRELLIYTLRERLNITGPHIGCETSHCGACTVTIDGKSVKSCTMFSVQAEGAEITTIEGIGGPDNLHPLQEAFKEHHGLQCGYCTPGYDYPRARSCLRKFQTRLKKKYALEWLAIFAAARATRIL